jgi:hypothetical protein
VVEDFEYRRDRLTLRIGEGEGMSLATRSDGLVEVGLDGVALEADIVLTRRKSLELAGAVTDGKIVDGMLDLDADLDLRTPFVLRPWPVRVAIVSADVALSIDDGEIESFRLRRPVVEVVRWWQPRRNDGSRGEHFRPDHAGNDLTMAQL